MKNAEAKQIPRAFILERIVHYGLFFLLAGIPLIVNPTDWDYYYKPKIHCVYALIVIIVPAAAVRRALRKDAVRLPPVPLTGALALFGTSAILSTVYSICPRLSITGDVWRLESVITLLAYAALVFIYAGLVLSEQQARMLLNALCFTAALVALYGIAQYAGFNPTEHYDPLFRSNRINSTIGNSNFLGKFLAFLMPLLLARFFMSPGPAGKLFFGSGFMLCACSLLLTFTRASWVSAALGAGLFVFLAGRQVLRTYKKQILALAAAALCFCAGLAAITALKSRDPSGLLFFTEKERILSTLDFKQGRGVATRLFVWRKVAGLIGQRPLLGFGPDTHVLPMSTFNAEYTEKFQDRVVLDRAHNNYLDLALAQGLLGLGAYLAVISTFMIAVGRRIGRETGRQGRLLLCGLFSAFAGYLFNDLFIFSVVSVSPTFWALMGLTCALIRLPSPLFGGVGSSETMPKA